jgi:hypothetical protein
MYKHKAHKVIFVLGIYTANLSYVGFATIIYLLRKFKSIYVVHICMIIAWSSKNTP